MISLGVIIVGAAAVVGVNLFQQGVGTSDREALYQKSTMILPGVIDKYYKSENMGGINKNFNNLPSTLSKKAKRLGIPLSSDLDTITKITVVNDSVISVEIEAKQESYSGIFEMNGEQSEIKWTTSP